MNTERRALWLSAGGALAVAVVGLVVAGIAESQAVLLDGMFNAVYVVVALVTLKVSRLVQRPDDRRFPFGYAYFEPLINAVKGLLMLGIAGIALVGAIDALLHGGREVAAGLAVGYAVFAMVIGFGVMAIMARAARTTDSPLVRADVKNWGINGAISAVVGLAFGAIFLLRGTRYSFLVPYVDPGLVTLMIIVTLPVPLKMVWSALGELVSAAPERAVVERVETAVTKALAPLEVRNHVVRVARGGRQVYALIHVVLQAGDLDVGGLDAERARMRASIDRDVPGLAVDIVFTADPRWAPPMMPAP